MSLSYSILNLRLDVALFAMASLAGTLVFRKIIQRKRKTERLPKLTWWLVLMVVAFGACLAEWVGEQRKDTLTAVFSGFAPTYAYELKQHGHDRITTETSPDDPTYLEMIDAQKNWLKINPLLADIYTFRRDDAGSIRLIVDSETDYDHSGAIDEEREQRTPIGEVYDEATANFHDALDGTPRFDTEFVPDRWGVWVSSLTPIYGEDGRVEAALGIDYPADVWITAILKERVIALIATFVLVGILLTSAAGSVLLGAEIAERKAAQEQLARDKETVDNMNRAKSEFLAVMSHEIRTPLNALMGFASVLAGTALDATQRRHLGTITTAGECLTAVLNDTLDIVKLEEGKLTIKKTPCLPAAQVNEVIDLMFVRALEKGLTLQADLALPPALTVISDSARIRQVLLNLVNNAIKFTDTGTVTVSAKWSPSPSKKNHGELTFDVIDTGVGIPDAVLTGLFRMFMRIDTSSTRRYGGTGLGLSICTRLSELMGGRIDVTSAVGKGSRFSFTLPCEQVAAIAPPPPAPGVTVAPFAPVSPTHHRALIVDDQRLNREVLKALLKRNGWDVVTAASGPEALACLAADTVDVVFMDLEMPEMDGFTTAQHIRALECAGAHLPIIALTANTVQGTRDRCLAAGMDEYLTKPVYLPAVLTTLKALVPTFQTPGEPPARANDPALATADAASVA